METACRFAEEGARGIVLMGRNPERGASACARVRSRAEQADVSFIAVDATDSRSVAHAAEQARERLETVDVLVTSTGPAKPPRLLHTIPLDDLQPTLENIVMPPLLMMGALLPVMRAQGHGCVVNVASDAAKVATPGESLIGASMAAIVMFSRTAALEAKREGVRINVVTPSLIADTPGADLLFADPFSAKLFQKASALATLGIPDPTDLADTILFLASSAARRITGQTLSVNGGISVA